MKGVYHINAVDEVTQMQVVYTVEKISEQFLLPVLETFLDFFPFTILGVHTDNGSEYVNRTVCQLLRKLLIEFTKSRARHSNDNALVEGKNGAIIRKYIGYIHIPQRHAARINTFYQTYLNPYINYHRPCYFAVTITDHRGKERKTYPYTHMMTPYEKFKSLPKAQSYLKLGVTLAKLDVLAMQQTDLAAAKKLQQARAKLFDDIRVGTRSCDDQT